MSDSNDQYLNMVPDGLDVVDSPAKSSAPDKPIPEQFPAMILSGTTGDGLGIGATVALKRDSNVKSDTYGKPVDGAKPRVRGFVVPISGGAATRSPGNQFGMRSANILSADLVELILDHEDEARELVAFLREHE